MRAWSKPLTAAQQYVNLRGNPICHGVGILHHGRLVWRYWTSPSPISRDYKVRIELSKMGKPTVFIESPDLQSLAGGRRIPHLYEQKPPQLCLYLPGAFEWQPWMRLDQTIVPWTALWLYYFEEWLESDDWKGGGVHPASSHGANRQEAA